MPNLSSIKIKARAVFSDAARVCFQISDQPIRSYDTETGVSLTYRFETHAGGVLRLSGGALMDQSVSVACDIADLNLIATLLVDGIKLSVPSHDL
jgi:hypothetical protein